jgi:helix-turn-helix protein
MSMTMVAYVRDFSNVSGSAHRLLLILASYAHPDSGLAWPSRARLVRDMGVSPQYVKRLQAKLIKIGALALVPGQGRGHFSCYRIVVDPEKVIHRKGQHFHGEGREKRATDVPEKRATPVPPIESKSERKNARAHAPQDARRGCPLRHDPVDFSTGYPVDFSTPYNKTQTRENQTRAHAPQDATRRCSWDGCLTPACPHTLACPYHSCCPQCWEPQG